MCIICKTHTPKETMSSKQVWLTRTAQVEEVIAEAHRTFPDADSDAHAIVRALFHWLHNRQENSKRGAIELVAKDVKEILTILRGEYDNTHG